jgi:hypothetical protein
LKKFLDYVSPVANCTTGRKITKEEDKLTRINNKYFTAQNIPYFFFDIFTAGREMWKDRRKYTRKNTASSTVECVFCLSFCLLQQDGK